MKFIAAFAAVLVCASTAMAQDGGPFKSEKETASYAVGLSIGRNLTRQGIELDTKAFMLGVTDMLSGKDPRLTPEQYQAAIQGLNARMQAKQAKSKAASSKKNLRDGKAFLAANKKKKGVVTLPSGLQYRKLRKGKGAKPKVGDTVETHYRGTLLDGKEFDSSYKRGSPTTFPVSGVIAGWTEALQLMQVGSKWKLFIPAKLAYGAGGAGQNIGPHATLIFEIELLKIK